MIYVLGGHFRAHRDITFPCICPPPRCGQANPKRLYLECHGGSASPPGYFSLFQATSYESPLALSSIVATMSEGMIVNPYINGGTFTQVNNINPIAGLQGVSSYNLHDALLLTSHD